VGRDDWLPVPVRFGVHQSVPVRWPAAEVAALLTRLRGHRDGRAEPGPLPSRIACAPTCRTTARCAGSAPPAWPCPAHAAVALSSLWEALEDDARLSRLFATGVRKLTYTYGLGAGWEHEIIPDKLVATPPGSRDRGAWRSPATGP
jgi:hypothetical protein